ncbi:MAG TPA: DUF1801 domain-containing protein [Microlunatus sp.]
MTSELLTGRQIMATVQDRGAVFDEVRIGRPATGALVDAGYRSLGDLPDDLDVLLKLHGVGPSAVARLTAARARGNAQEGAARTPNAVDAYIAGFPPEVAERLTKLRATITKHFDGGEETIRYGMPAMMVGEHYGLHFAGWKKHVALYPVPVLAEPLESAVAPYRSGKDAVTFRHTQQLPYDLVGRICDAIAEQRPGDARSSGRGRPR